MKQHFSFFFLVLFFHVLIAVKYMNLIYIYAYDCVYVLICVDVDMFVYMWIYLFICVYKIYLHVYNTMNFIEHQNRAITGRMMLQIPKVKNNCITVNLCFCRNKIII